MNGEQDTGLPLSFYGLNYLGRPVHVGVQGESPTAQAAGATPTGALGVGPTGAGGPGAATPSGTPSAPGTSDAATSLQALGLTQNVSSAASKLGGATGGALGLSPGATEAGITGAGIPGTETEALAGAQAALIGDTGGAAGTAGGTGGAASEAASAGAGIEGAAALIPVVLSALQVAGVPIPKPITAAEQFGSVGEFGAGVNLAADPSWANAARFGEALGTFGLSEVGRAIFGGKPPAMTFPGSTYQQIHSQVSSNLPPTLPIPTNATPEQQKAIQDANAAIKEVSDSLPPEQPSWLGGKQSAETWNNVLNMIKTGTEQGFAKIQSLYPAALSAFQESGPMTMPTGAPPALAEAITAANDPVTQLLTGLQKGAPYTGLSGLGDTYTTASQAARDAMTRFGPQLEAAKTLPTGFFEGEKRRLPEAA